jgi:pre-mRNA-splicing factor SYF1
MLQGYEKGIALFKWPNVFDIWNTYLTKFLKRYGGEKLERARDLFEQCLENCPPKFAKGECNKRELDCNSFDSFCNIYS